jgi:hypothetical protein
VVLVVSVRDRPHDGRKPEDLMARASSFLALAAVALTGCGTTTFDFQGDELYQYFPFNGTRIWTYQSTDTSLSYLLRAELQEDNELLEDSRTRVYTVDFTTDCRSADDGCEEGALAFSWKMSADSSKGTLIHAIGEDVFDPPVRLADPQMNIGETTETASGDATYTATYEDFVDCPAPYWRGAPPRCAHLSLSDGEDTGASPITGDFWATVQFNVVAFRLDGLGQEWQLREVDFDD